MKTFDPFPACMFCDAPVEDFEPGPKGGSSQNMTCRRCGARYNLLIPVGIAVRRSGEVLGRGPLFLEVLEGPSSNAVPLSDAAAVAASEALGVKSHPGYAAVFTRDRADGAIACGARITKTNSEAGDRYPDGTLGTVLGSLNSPLGIFYFVEWDTMPGVAVGIAFNRIAENAP